MSGSRPTRHRWVTDQDVPPYCALCGLPRRHPCHSPTAAPAKGNRPCVLCQGTGTIGDLPCLHCQPARVDQPFEPEPATLFE